MSSSSSNVVKSSKKPLIIGGKLKLKSSTTKPSYKSNSFISSSTTTSSNNNSNNINTISNNMPNIQINNNIEEYLTVTQKKHQQKLTERNELDAKKLSTVSFRDRVDEFNSKLAKMTEHNDIPRVSAAGNG